MPVTIDELDAMVRAFYEGRGEQVLRPLGSFLPAPPCYLYAVMLISYSITIAKSCSSCSEPGKLRRPAASNTPLPPVANQLAQFKEDSDSWLMVANILSKSTYPQTKCTP